MNFVTFAKWRQQNPSYLNLSSQQTKERKCKDRLVFVRDLFLFPKSTNRMKIDIRCQIQNYFETNTIFA
jgi:hypothetical protein